ncbi:hypothetical protein [Cysteiniphilum sp. 6C5]|uniref:hypothetical protein n=1 Tax=unclassified Cysteiniphilum TaxID=2610889 RepID=UPI003F87276E
MTNVSNRIPLEKIYDHNLNILIGSGASYGLFPTLALALEGGEYTIEKLAENLENNESEHLKTLLFMHYYKECIKPISDFNLDASYNNQDKKNVVENYQTFLSTLLKILDRKRNKKINLFTTNYDGCLPFIAESLLKEKDFIINDGTSGFRKKYLKASNINISSNKTGIFDQYKVDIPQVNLINLHGSIYWRKEEDKIIIDYYNKHEEIVVCQNLQEFSSILSDASKSINDVKNFTCEIESYQKDIFWESYNKLPIVNPTKWKFHETVFEEHYYQMLRLMSYELEKPSSILISFGFSFADEHIENLVKRSLSNPKLQVYVCCFNDSEKQKMQNKFNGFDNVEYICNDFNGDLDFNYFNGKVFKLGNNDER